MKKGNFRTVGPLARVTSQQLYIPGRQLVQRSLDVVHLKGNVVHTLTPSVNETGDRTVRFHGLEEFNPHLAEGQHSHPNFLVRQLLDPGTLQTEHLPVESQRRFQVPHSDADVVDFPNHGCLPITAPSQAGRLTIFPKDSPHDVADFADGSVAPDRLQYRRHDVVAPQAGALELGERILHRSSIPR